jgi:hypothetical protein
VQHHSGRDVNASYPPPWPGQQRYSMPPPPPSIRPSDPWAPPRPPVRQRRRLPAAVPAALVAVIVLIVLAVAWGFNLSQSHVDKSSDAYLSGFDNGMNLTRTAGAPGPARSATLCSSAERVNALMGGYAGRSWIQGCYDGINSVYPLSAPKKASTS